MAKAKAPSLFEDGELADAPEPLIVQALAIYNAVAKRVNEAAGAQVWCEAKALTAKRRKRLAAAIPDYGGTRGWQDCLEQASRNPFLLGKEGRTGTHRAWKPDLDFFLQEKTVLRLIEGGYPAEVKVPERIHIPSGFVPAHKRQEKPFVQTETLEQRLAASIVSYRRIGNFARANEIEERLAVLEKRPPVLVPSPEARDPDVIPAEPATRFGQNRPDSAKPVQTRPFTDVVDEYDGVPEGEQYEDD